MSGLSIAKSLELVLLGPAVSREDVETGCELARSHHLAAVTVFPVHVRRAATLLQGSDARVIAAIGFPFGQETVDTRLRAIEAARADGAHEVAVMLDASAMASVAVDDARRELERVLTAAFWNSLVTTRGQGHLTIVVETMPLELQRWAPLWDLLHDSAASFLQTSGGLGQRSVTEEHVRELRQLLPADVQVKAVGGVGTLEDATGLINAGAVRVGSASAVAIAEQERNSRQVSRGA